MRYVRCYDTGSPRGSPSILTWKPSSASTCTSVAPPSRTSSTTLSARSPWGGCASRFRAAHVRYGRSEDRPDACARLGWRPRRRGTRASHGRRTMTIVDANVLLYAVNPATNQHRPARRWLDRALSSGEPVGPRADVTNETLPGVPHQGSREARYRRGSILATTGSPPGGTTGVWWHLGDGGTWH